MSYRYDKNDDSIVIDGFEAGVGDSPYQGPSDIRNANIISIPTEASVGFSTVTATLPSCGGSVTSASAADDTISFTNSVGSVTNTQAVVFAGGGLPPGITAGTVYWVFNVGATFQIAIIPGSSTPVNITGTGTGTYTSIDIGKPTYFDSVTGSYLIDANGRAWYYPGVSWVYLGNTTLTNASGNGIVTYLGYLFVFRNKRIDYMSLTSLGTWVYGWNPTSGGSGADSLNTGAGVSNPHQPLVGQDNVVYIPDAAYVASFFQTDPSTTFDPTSLASFTWAQKALALPSSEVAMSLAELGVNLMVGGSKNAVYPWNRTAPSFTYPILIAENTIYKMVTVNTNTYLFAGVRGRIYITNGSQAQLYKKVPDHISGTVEPYYTWGGVAAQKNQLYFGVQATTNGLTAINQYGGVWAIDLDTTALRLVNKLSYGTYAGTASAIYGLSSATAGYGLYVGWDSGASTYGVDISSSTPYIAGETVVTSELIPIGTYLEKRTFSKAEYKLSAPLVAGESVVLAVASTVAGSFTDLVILDANTQVGQISCPFDFSVERGQWIKIRATLTGTSSSPSYVRLKEIRLR
jgi:hypothetical protein